MSSLFVLCSCLLISSVPVRAGNHTSQIPPDHTTAIELSQQLLLAAKTGAPTEQIAGQLARLTQNALTEQLTTDSQKKAFWINVYNAYTQIMLSKNADQYKKRSRFFKKKSIGISGRMLSLDLIEHGILRRSKLKWSLGYLNKIFPNSFEKNNRVGKLDYRIHFSLNCGAKSCPPISFYKPEQLDKQLDMATKVYLQGECEYDSIKNSVAVPALMNWFRHDFGGKKNMKFILRKLSIIPADKNPGIHFKKYDWDLVLANYKNE